MAMPRPKKVPASCPFRPEIAQEQPLELPAALSVPVEVAPAWPELPAEPWPPVATDAAVLEPPAADVSLDLLPAEAPAWLVLVLIVLVPPAAEPPRLLDELLVSLLAPAPPPVPPARLLVPLVPAPLATVPPVPPVPLTPPEPAGPSADPEPASRGTLPPSAGGTPPSGLALPLTQGVGAGTVPLLLILMA